MTKNYFQGTIQNPYHISIGAVVRNQEGKVCTHYFDTLTVKSIGALNDFYLLMRETIEPGESIETCLARGLMEEFGITATLQSYLGSIVSNFVVKDTETSIQKTTLYFLCNLISIDESKRKAGDLEATSKLEWLEPAVLIEKMKEQGVRLGREDVDESAVLENMASI